MTSLVLRYQVTVTPEQVTVTKTRGKVTVTLFRDRHFGQLASESTLLEAYGKLL